MPLAAEHAAQRTHGGTGRTAIVETIAEVWSAAEGLSGRSFDPLDEGYLAALASSARATQTR
jgi:hypothetical protein